VATFFKGSGLQESFHTWYAITVLHLWMVFVRLRRDGRAGQELSQTIFDNFWADAEARMVESKISNPITLSRAVKHFTRVYYGAVVAYDESLGSHDDADMLLAEALWRNIFGMEEIEAVPLEEFVEYVRRELTNLDGTQNVVIHGSLVWGPPPVVVVQQ